ncbi:MULTISPECIES: hypothetical protein [unclassified Idiomarina]|uniref:hypothetical protein n=1 Tax=unclassified Idiomarina TaxID=2614829 RepID=UPI0008F9157B|nr:MULTISPECIES: hypothetical protein [unclassified Idiomarina]MAD53828.1 hypothetical protein [Idiomarinaceae bacterium]MEC7642221.1 hypothetical protein [Pseudomonadota bacterium]MEC8925711.1 hypothetical protein [Pseudomonadota bacterium]MEC9318515.1 hypothetical protein [Pseudomonadota bacterium]NQZ05276.1 hypothetical protein [Idiomarina sp.]
MLGNEEPFSVTGNTILLRNENKKLLLVTGDRYKNILVSRSGVEMSDWGAERRPGVRVISLQEIFKRDKTYFFIRAGGVEYQVDLKFQESPITEMKF